MKGVLVNLKYFTNRRLVSKGTVVSSPWRSETVKFCIKAVDEGQISTVKRKRG